MNDFAIMVENFKPMLSQKDWAVILRKSPATINGWVHGKPMPEDMAVFAKWMNNISDGHIEEIAAQMKENLSAAPFIACALAKETLQKSSASKYFAA